MNKFALFIAGTALFGLAASPLAAMPRLPIDSAPVHHVTEIAGGCGPGWHRGPRGGCRHNWARPGMHACPRGYHLGPNGHCRGNRR